MAEQEDPFTFGTFCFRNQVSRTFHLGRHIDPFYRHPERLKFLAENHPDIPNADEILGRAAHIDGLLEQRYSRSIVLVDKSDDLFLFGIKRLSADRGSDRK